MSIQQDSQINIENAANVAKKLTEEYFDPVQKSASECADKLSQKFSVVDNAVKIFKNILFSFKEGGEQIQDKFEALLTNFLNVCSNHSYILLIAFGIFIICTLIVGIYISYCSHLTNEKKNTYFFSAMAVIICLIVGCLSVINPSIFTDLQ